ncbi:hypothetical protein MRX96_053095, partial [Rhipicephalus microplus]
MVCFSEAGASPPQSGVFSLLLYFGSLLACATMLVRYVVIRNLNRCCRWSVDVLNVAALMAGTPRRLREPRRLRISRVDEPDDPQRWRVHHYNAKSMVWLRFSLTTASVFAVIFTACYQYVGENLWVEGLNDKPKHLREPGDP